MIIIIFALLCALCVSVKKLFNFVAQDTLCSYSNRTLLTVLYHNFNFNFSFNFKPNAFDVHMAYAHCIILTNLGYSMGRAAGAGD